jgi:FMN-dependent NADH-azoreductase
MKKVLVINSSARAMESHSRKLTEVFVDHWKSIHTDSIIRYRELGNADVPHINERWIEAAFQPKATRSAEDNEVLKTSDAYVSELQEADVIVLGAPMYNWSIPSYLKAYIDQILRINVTWKFNPDDMRNPYIGLLENKTLFLLLSRGTAGYEKGEFHEHLNFQSTYLRAIFNIMGITNIHVVAINGTSSGSEEIKKAIDAAHQIIRDLVEAE